MVEAGADLDAEDCFQWTPMHRAALDNPGAVRVLIESGAKVNKLNKDQIYDGSVTPLFYAAKYSHRDAIIALYAAGAHPRLDLSPLDADCVKDDMKTLIREQFPVRLSSLICSPSSHNVVIKIDKNWILSMLTAGGRSADVLSGWTFCQEDVLSGPP